MKMIAASLLASCAAMLGTSTTSAPAQAQPAAPPTTRAQQLMGHIAPKLAELTDNVLFGDVWERPGLSKRDRSLVTISALIAMNRPDQLRSHLARAADSREWAALYPIVRPGWFDYNEADERLPVLLQGDTRQTGRPQDGAIARDLIAAVLVRSLESDAALNKTFELIAARGATLIDFDPLFEAVLADPTGALDGVGDADNMPPADEPNRVKRDLATEHARHQTPAA